MWSSNRFFFFDLTYDFCFIMIRSCFLYIQMRLIHSTLTKWMILNRFQCSLYEFSMHISANAWFTYHFHFLSNFYVMFWIFLVSDLLLWDSSFCFEHDSSLVYLCNKTILVCNQLTDFLQISFPPYCFFSLKHYRYRGHHHQKKIRRFHHLTCRNIHLNYSMCCIFYFYRDPFC